MEEPEIDAVVMVRGVLGGETGADDVPRVPVRSAREEAKPPPPIDRHDRCDARLVGDLRLPEIEVARFGVGDGERDRSVVERAAEGGRHDRPDHRRPEPIGARDRDDAGRYEGLKIAIEVVPPTRRRGGEHLARLRPRGARHVYCPIKDVARRDIEAERVTRPRSLHADAGVQRPRLSDRAAFVERRVDGAGDGLEQRPRGG